MLLTIAHMNFMSLFLKKYSCAYRKTSCYDTSQLHNIIKNKKNSKIYLGFNRPKSNILDL